MRGKGPCKPVPQEAAHPAGISLGPGDGGPVILPPLVDWGNASDAVVPSPPTHLLGRNQTHEMVLPLAT